MTNASKKAASEATVFTCPDCAGDLTSVDGVTTCPDCGYVPRQGSD